MSFQIKPGPTLPRKIYHELRIFVLSLLAMVLFSSYIDASNIPRDVEALRIMIQNAFIEKILVRDLGKFKFLLTMESKEIKEKMKTEEEGCLKQWFSSITDWAEGDVCQTRRLWLEIVGVPIQL